MGKKILLVDDEEEILFVLGTRLKASHYEVITASNGREALEKVKSESPDVIILDVLMPEMTGFQLVEQLRNLGELSAKLKVIVMSAKPTMKEHFSETDIVTFIPKPFDNEYLLSTVESLMGEEESGQAFSSQPVSGSQARKGEGKLVLLAGVEDFLREKLKALLEEKGYAVFIALNEEEMIKEAANIRPAAILSQFWEEPSKLDTAHIQERLSRNPETSSIPFAAYCTQGISMDAYKSMKTANIIAYSESSDLVKKVESFLKEKT